MEAHEAKHASAGQAITIPLGDGLTDHFWPPLPEGPFDLIEADANWRYKGYSKVTQGNTRAPERHYKTATIEQIAALPVKSIAAKNCHLMFWITGSQFVQGAHLPIFEAWGFKPSSVAFVWLKVNRFALNGRFFNPINPKDFFMGLGKTTRQNCEFVLLGRRGSPKRHHMGIRQTIIEPRREHSRKPDSFYDDCRKYAGDDARMVSLFSRTHREGWTVWGDEVEKFKDGE